MVSLVFQPRWLPGSMLIYQRVIIEKIWDVDFLPIIFRSHLKVPKQLSPIILPEGITAITI